MYDGDISSAGMIAGIGRVEGREVMVVVNDATVKGGTYYPLTVKKHLRAQEIALQNNLPCVYLVDSGGANLPNQDEVFPDREHFGRIFYNQANMSAAGIPQIACVMGSCTAGGAYVPAMSDESIMVQQPGDDLPRRPAAGEGGDRRGSDGRRPRRRGRPHAAIRRRRPLRHGRRPRAGDCAADRQEPESEEADRARSQKAAFRRLYRSAMSSTASCRRTRASPTTCARSSRALSTAREFDEFKQNYGTTLVTGFAHLYGMPVGIIANNGVLFSESALKGAHFIELCCQRKIPLVFLQNITGFMVGRKYEAGGIAKDGAKLVTAVATAAVPKVTMIVGGSFGAGNYGMCGRAFSPRFLWMWPNARISVMGGEQAATVLAMVKREGIERKGGEWSAEEEAEFKRADPREIRA